MYSKIYFHYNNIIIVHLYACNVIAHKMVFCQVATNCCLIRNRILTEEVNSRKWKILYSRRHLYVYFYIVVYYIILLCAVKRVLRTGAGKHFGKVPGSPPSTFIYSCRWSLRRLPILHFSGRWHRSHQSRRDHPGWKNII